MVDCFLDLGELFKSIFLLLRFCDLCFYAHSRLAGSDFPQKQLTLLVPSNPFNWFRSVIIAVGPLSLVLTISLPLRVQALEDFWLPRFIVLVFFGIPAVWLIRYLFEKHLPLVINSISFLPIFSLFKPLYFTLLLSPVFDCPLLAIYVSHRCKVESLLLLKKLIQLPTPKPRQGLAVLNVP